MLFSIFVATMSAGVLLFILSLVLIFVLKIPELIDELSGNKAKRQIKRLKELNSATSSLDSMATKDIYGSVASGALSLGEMAIEESIKKSVEIVDKSVDNSSAIKEEIKTGRVDLSRTAEDEEATNYMGDEDSEQSTGYMSGSPEVGMQEDQEETTGYMSGSPKVDAKDDQEESTGFMVEPPIVEEVEVPTGYIAEEEQPTGYIDWEQMPEESSNNVEEDEEQSTGFMDDMEDEDLATGILSDLSELVLNKSIVEIIEEQTSLNLSVAL